MNVTWRKAKAVLAVPLALCLTMTGVNQTAFAEEAGTGDTVGTGGVEAASIISAGQPDAEEGQGELIYQCIDLGKVETSALQWDFFAVDSSGKVALKDENFERWIDRINVPDYAITFYNTLVEGADNDNKSDGGDSDIRIPPCYCH